MLVLPLVAILTGSQVVLNLGMGFMVPVLPLFAREMGGHLGATGVGLIIAAPSITRLVCNLPFGMLADKIGRKPLMWVGTGLTAVGTMATGFVTSLGSMLWWRLLIGVGNAASMTGSSAYMQDLSDKAPEHRGKILGFQQATIGSVWIFGPAMGGFLAEAYGFRNAFVIAGVGSALCSLGYRQLPETLKLTLEPAREGADKDATAEGLLPRLGMSEATFTKNFSEWRRNAAELCRDPNQQALIALSLASPMRGACYMTVLPLHLADTLNAGPADIGMVSPAFSFPRIAKALFCLHCYWFQRTATECVELTLCVLWCAILLRLCRHSRSWRQQWCWGCRWVHSSLTDSRKTSRTSSFPQVLSRAQRLLVQRTPARGPCYMRAYSHRVRPGLILYLYRSCDVTSLESGGIIAAVNPQHAD